MEVPKKDQTFKAPNNEKDLLCKSKHFLLELYKCDHEKLNDESFLRCILNKAAKLKSKIYSKIKTNCIKCNGVGYLRTSLEEARTCLCCYGKGFLIEEIQRF